jgi:hypothetical protein
MANEKQQYVYLFPQRDEAGVTWTWLYNGQSGPASTFPVIEAKKNSGGHDIYFTVFDPQNTIKFAGYNGPDTTKAIAIAEKQPTAPKPNTGIDTKGEVKEITFKQDGAQLFLDNTNKKIMTLSYTLNFVDSSTGQAVTSIDPELKNNGGGGIRFDSYIVGSILISVMLTLVFARFALGWRKV